MGEPMKPSMGDILYGVYDYTSYDESSNEHKLTLHATPAGAARHSYNDEIWTVRVISRARRSVELLPIDPA